MPSGTESGGDKALVPVFFRDQFLTAQALMYHCGAGSPAHFSIPRTYQPIQEFRRVS